MSADDDNEGERLWRMGLTGSVHLRRLIEIYPSYRQRMGLVLERADPKIAQTVRVLLDRAEALDSSPQAGDLELRFGLTSAEARLAHALANGAKLSGYAGLAGISLQTARNQLQAVFQKTGVNRQGELVSLLLRGSGGVTTGKKTGLPGMN